MLQYGQTYSIAIQLNNTTPGSTPVPGCNICTIDSRSNSFFDYTPINTSNTPNLPVGAVVNLPTVFPIPTTSGLVSPSLYSFHVPDVGPSAGMTFIDPVIATGFIYTIGAGDPFFASVEPITNVGSGIYQLLVWDSNSNQFVLVDSALAAGQTFNFLSLFPKGVSQFEITGIDPSAGLDPTNITAFITGLTFIGDGSFTGTMQAIEAAATPLPATWILMLTGIAGIGFAGYHRNKKHSAAIVAI